MPDQVLGDRGLRHRDSNLQQFSVNAGSSPARVGEAHFPDQIPNFWRYTRSSFKMATLPIPIQSKPLRCQAMTVSGLTRSSAANRSTIAKARPTGHGQPNGDAAYAHGSDPARPEADAGVQESLLAEQRELGNNLAERRVRSAWSGQATGRESVNANNFNENGLFGRDRLKTNVFTFDQPYKMAPLGFQPRKSG
jgi:hypothetical protein